MDEKTARTRWCPMVRHTDIDNNNACNRAGPVTKPMGWNSCIASDCMMWVTDSVSATHTAEMDEEGKIGEVKRLSQDATNGHCGLIK